MGGYVFLNRARRWLEALNNSNLFARTFISILLLIPSVSIYLNSFERIQNIIASKTSLVGDQQAIFITFQSAFTQKQVPHFVETGWMPVGYLSLIGFFHKISAWWVEPDFMQTFYFHSLFYAVLAALISVTLMYFMARDQSPHSNKIVLALAASLFWLCMFRFTNVFRFVFIPWSHHAACFVGVSFIFALYHFLTRKTKLWLACTILFAALFALTRRHEASAVFLSVGMALLVSWSWKTKIKDILNVKRIFSFVLTAMVGFGLAIGFAVYFSNGMPLNAHYEQQRKSDSYIDQYLKLYPQIVPLKFYQTFVDPDFYSYSPANQTRHPVKGFFFRNDFSMPLIIQLSWLWFLIPMALSIGILLLRNFPFGYRSSAPAVNQPVMTIFFIGFFSFVVLTFGYLSSAVWGSPHLQNGLVREFMLAILLFTIGVGPALFLYLGQKQIRLVVGIPALGMVLLPLVLGQWLFANNYDFFLIKSKHLNPVGNYSHTCINGSCSLNLEFLNLENEKIDAPFKQIILNYYCSAGLETNPYGIKEAGETISMDNLNFEVIKCQSMVDVQVYAVFTGFAGSGMPLLKFSTCPKKEYFPDCQEPSSIQ